MSEVVHLCCDGKGCTRAITVEAAMGEGWWHGQFICHQPAEDNGPSERFDVDLCVECANAFFEDYSADNAPDQA